MKTAIFINNIFNTGGTEVVSIEYAKLLKKQGETVCFITIDSGDVFPNELKEEKIEVFILRGKNNNKELSDEQIQKALNYCVENNVENSLFIVNIPHKISPVSNLDLILRLSKITKCEVVFHSSPKSYLTRYWSLRYGFVGNVLRKIKTLLITRPYAKHFIKTLYKNGISLYSTTKGGQQELKRYYGVDSKIRYNWYVYRDIEFPDKKNIVTYCGRLAFEKNVLLLLNAWKQCNTTDWKLRLIGTGKEKDLLETFCIKNHLDNVEFCGSVNHERIYDYFAESKICVLTSFYEGGYPTVFVEAMNMGNVIFSTKYDGFSDELLTPETSIITDYKVSHYANALNELLNDPERINKMGHNAFAKCKEFYHSSEYLNNVK